MTQPEMSPGEAARLFPRGVGDPFCPAGGRITTPTDHRLLWHLESVLAVDAPTAGSRLDEVRQDLRRYLNVRCDHHWHHSTGDDMYPELWQCLWCNDVLVHPEAPKDAEKVCDPARDIEYWPSSSPAETPL